MILAAHVIVTAYGFWLPNEPRGSWSDFVRSWDLYRYGPATKVDHTRSVAHKPYDKKLRAEMQRALARMPVKFTGRQALTIAKGFAREVEHSHCEILACAILPEHFHLVVARHTYDFNKLIIRLKGSATRSLREANLHPFSNEPYRDRTLPTPWGHKAWTAYLDSEVDIARAIRYVQANPIKENKPCQTWSFVAPFLNPLDAFALPS